MGYSTQQIVLIGEFMLCLSDWRLMDGLNQTDNQSRKGKHDERHGGSLKANIEACAR